MYRSSPRHFGTAYDALKFLWWARRQEKLDEAVIGDFESEGDYLGIGNILTIEALNEQIRLVEEAEPEPDWWPTPESGHFTNGRPILPSGTVEALMHLSDQDDEYNQWPDDPVLNEYRKFYGGESTAS